ncbi:collagen triple helix repeat-containing protein 1-like [Oculina patagonica]
MNIAVISFVLFLFLLLPADCAVYGKKNVSTPAKIPSRCLRGPPGLPGRNGVNGHNGLPGPYGRDGAKGEKGMAGSPGPRGDKGENGTAGPPGPRGGKGEKGVAGSSGPRGVKGDAGKNGTDANQRNWKQCVWRSTDGRDVGLIKYCVFDKKKDETALRVVYQGSFYMNCNSCCKRWFITFNGAECSGPMPIDVVWYMHSSNQITHKPGAIEGYCDNIHKGKIRVAINIGNCPGYGNCDGETGWKSVSRLMIEEVPRSQ